MSNIRTILGALITIPDCNLKKTSLVTTNPQKRNSSKKVKSRKVGVKQVKYSSTKPIKSRVVRQFRNKSNI